MDGYHVKIMHFLLPTTHISFPAHCPHCPSLTFTFLYLSYPPFTSTYSIAGTPNWRIAVEVEGKWVNPLMGWTSTADHIETVSRKLQFTSKDAAIAWCEKMGMRYEIAEPGVITSKRPKRFNGYGSNFDVARKGTPVGGLRSEHLEAAGNASKGKKK